MATPSPVIPTDEELALAAGRGERPALATLYERHAAAVHDVAARALRDREAAADVVQATFVKAWESLSRGDPVRHTRAWLLTIARNAAIDVMRRRGREVPLPGRRSGSDDDETPELEVVDPTRAADPELAAADAELVRLVWSAATALGPRDASLLDLHLRQGLTIEELAATLGRTTNATYVALSRLRAALEESVVAHLFSRPGGSDCRILGTRLAAVPLDATPREIRQVVTDHLARGCERCEERRRRLVSPVALFGSLAAAPFPADRAAEIWARVAAAMGPEGAPTSTAPRISRSTVVAAGAAGVALLLGLAVAIGALDTAGRVHDPGDVRSTSHAIGVPSADPVIAIAWTPPAGAVGYSVAWAPTPTLPDEVVDVAGDAGGAESDVLEPGSWYFTLRTRSPDGSWTSTVELGPFVLIGVGPSTPPGRSPSAPLTPATTAAPTPGPTASPTLGPTPSPTPTPRRTPPPAPPPPPGPTAPPRHPPP